MKESIPNGSIPNRSSLPVISSQQFGLNPGANRHRCQGMEGPGEVAVLNNFDNNSETGQITGARCTAISRVEEGHGKIVYLLFKNRHKGLCEDCIEEMRPKKKLMVRNRDRKLFASVDRRAGKMMRKRRKDNQGCEPTPRPCNYSPCAGRPHLASVKGVVCQCHILLLSRSQNASSMQGFALPNSCSPPILYVCTSACVTMHIHTLQQ